MVDSVKASSSSRTGDSVIEGSRLSGPRQRLSQLGFGGHTYASDVGRVGQLTLRSPFRLNCLVDPLQVIVCCISHLLDIAIPQTTSSSLRLPPLRVTNRCCYSAGRDSFWRRGSERARELRRNSRPAQTACSLALPPSRVEFPEADGTSASSSAPHPRSHIRQPHLPPPHHTHPLL